MDQQIDGIDQKNCPRSETGLRFRQSLFDRVSDRDHGTLFDYILKVTQELGEDQAFYTFDFADILKKTEIWRKRMKDIQPYYAVKTNSDPLLLRLLVLLGLSFDCATEGEMRMVIKAGGDPKNIIFAHTIKTPRSLKYASGVGVEWMTFDDEDELLKINRHYPNAKLLLRLTPEDVKCSFDLSEKFGCHFKDTPRLLQFARELNLNVIGVSFHVGCLCENPNSFAATIRTSRKVFDIAQKLGYSFKILDIGGGFIGASGSEKFFEEVAETINSCLADVFPGPDVEIIAEPGTYFAASACRLTTAICGKKKRNSEDTRQSTLQRYYYLNESIYGSFFKDYQEFDVNLKPLLKPKELAERPIYRSRLWGMTCDGLDVILEDCVLPDLNEGEYLVWENIGAYNQVLCSTFCGMPLPASRYVFVDTRLDLDWLTNPEEISDFITEVCTLVEEGVCQSDQGSKSKK